MLSFIPILLIVGYLAYKFGRASGPAEAVSHCDLSFLRRLTIIKGMVDNMLVECGMTSHAPETLELVVNGQIFFKGSAQELAERSIELDQLIAQLRKTHPELDQVSA